MKDGVMEAGERTRSHIKKCIKRLEREFSAKGIISDLRDARQLPDVEYEAYLELQLLAHRDNLGEMSDAEFEAWLQEYSSTGVTGEE